MSSMGRLIGHYINIYRFSHSNNGEKIDAIQVSVFDENEDINMAPMIDMVFLLLIFL